MTLTARWTLGPSNPAGIECLHRSIECFQRLYKAEIIVCYNGNVPDRLQGVRLYDQSPHLGDRVTPLGVAWKLYPGRLNPSSHELFIDNDLILTDRLPEINQFLVSNTTLLLEGESRNYGRFDRHVPREFKINSGLFGVPPGFDLDRQIAFYTTKWERNAGPGFEASATFDEQGLVAAILLSHPKYLIVSGTDVRNCEWSFEKAKGYHFVGLNRRFFHHPFQEFKFSTLRSYL